MIPYSPHPILVTLTSVPFIGTIAIRYYGLAYLTGFVLAYVWLRKKFGPQQAEDVLFWIVLATIVGGRLGEFIFYSPQTFWTNPLEILYINHGGMSFHGALLALFAVMWWYARSHNMRFTQLADTIVVPATIGIILGRIANFLNGELVGTQTTVAWCMQFPGYAGCRHPSQLYEALYTVLILGVLAWQAHKAARVKHQEGFLFVVFLTLYGLLRFVFNFLRDDPRVLGISTGQALSLCMFLVGVYLLGTKYKKSAKKFFS